MVRYATYDLDIDDGTTIAVFGYLYKGKEHLVAFHPPVRTMNPSQEGNAQDAMQRLVRAMMGFDDGAAMSLARRVLGSHIGAASHDSDRKHIDLSTTLRRISRKATDSNCRSETEQIYRRLERQCDDPELPPKVLAVLTKLMGKKIRQPAPFRNAPTKDSNQISQTNQRASVRTVPVISEQQIRAEKKELDSEEALLLRECLYSLQGIDGERIRYYHRGSKQSSFGTNDYEGVRVQSPALSHALLYSGHVMETRLGSGAMDALRISGEAGWLYNRVQSYIYNVQRDESKGVVARAFAGTLAEELREYHSLLTQYESKLSDLTLRQLMVDLRMPTSRLKILALLTDGLQDFSGGHLLSALHKHSLHGDTRHASLVQFILSSASRPWFDILYTWTTQGVLSDPHNEFFVCERLDIDDKHLWKDKYRINKDQIPDGILDHELVQPAFNVGKGINFIRRCLLDGKWTMQLQLGEDDGGFNGDSSLGYRYRPESHGQPQNYSLKKTLERATHLVHTHILHTLKEDNHMIQHLLALKQFFLLGQGDFFSALMDGLHKEFSNKSGVAGIYKHTLLSIVEGALRSTNAKYMPQYVLDRLKVELLVLPEDDAYNVFGPDKNLASAREDRRTVWDIFMLDYQIPDPLTAIVHSTSLDKYKMLFSLLFRLRKIEFILNFTWRQSATLQHALHTSSQYTGLNVSTSTGFAQATFLLRKISIVRQSMTHLIVNLKSYLMFEVLEGGWRRLQLEIDAAKTLDEVIEAHDRYIEGIVRKSLLRVDTDDKSQRDLSDQLQTLMAIIGEFCDLQETLFHDALISAEIAAEKRIEVDRRTNDGQWGFDSQQDAIEQEKFFGLASTETMQEVLRIENIYNQNALEMLRALAERVNGDSEDSEDKGLELEDSYEIRINRRTMDFLDNESDPQRFLMAQLDHNNYYGAQAVDSTLPSN